MLGFKPHVPMAGINDNFWTVGRGNRRTFSAPSKTFMRKHQSALLDRSHTFNEQVAMGVENGRLVKRISEIASRTNKEKESLAPKVSGTDSVC